MQLTYHKMHHFKGCNSVVLTDSLNFSLSNSKTFWLSHKETLSPLAGTPLFSLCPASDNHWSILSLQICLFWIFDINGTHDMWPLMSGFFHLTCFQVHTCCIMRLYFTPFYEWLTFYSMNTPHSTHSSADGHQDCFQFGPITHNWCVSFNFLRYMLRKEIAGCIFSLCL